MKIIVSRFSYGGLMKVESSGFKGDIDLMNTDYEPEEEWDNIMVDTFLNAFKDIEPVVEDFKQIEPHLNMPRNALLNI